LLAHYPTKFEEIKTKLDDVKSGKVAMTDAEKNCLMLVAGEQATLHEIRNMAIAFLKLISLDYPALLDTLNKYPIYRQYESYINSSIIIHFQRE